MKLSRRSAQLLMNDDSRFIRQTVRRLPLEAVRGRGAWLFGPGGERYLDFFTGHGTMCLGHNHPALKRAMFRQMGRIVHAGNFFYLEPRTRLAGRLSAAFYGGQVFFANSGAEIVELAIKLCRRNKSSSRIPEIICMKNSFHGRTYGALTATRQDYYKKGMGPFLPGFTEVGFNDTEALGRAFDSKTAGVLIEPVLGEGGVIPATGEFLLAARSLCDRYAALLVFDEIQTGLGRTGTLFGFQQAGVVPDVLLLGKPLGCGLPISALITRQEIAGALDEGDHGSTFGGNPVAASAGCALFDIVRKDAFLANIRKNGEILRESLCKLKDLYPTVVKEVRGAGLLLGMELFFGAAEAVRLALENRLIINNPIGDTLRFLPPYNVTHREIRAFALRFGSALSCLERKAEHA